MQLLQLFQCPLSICSRIFMKSLNFRSQSLSCLLLSWLNCLSHCWFLLVTKLHHQFLVVLSTDVWKFVRLTFANVQVSRFFLFISKEISEKSENINLRYFCGTTSGWRMASSLRIASELRDNSGPPPIRGALLHRRNCPRVLTGPWVVG